MRKKHKVGIIFILAFLFVFLISVLLERQNTKTDISDFTVVEGKREGTDGIYMEGRIPSLERQQNFLGEGSIMENIEHYIVYDNDLYGITSEGKAVLVDMYRENEEIDGRKTIVVPDNVNGYPVTEIMEDGMSAFWTEELRLPSTLQRMGAEALGGFFLSSVTMPGDLEIREAYRSEINDEGDEVPKKHIYQHGVAT